MYSDQETKGDKILEWSSLFKSSTGYESSGTVTISLCTCQVAFVQRSHKAKNCKEYPFSF